MKSLFLALGLLLAPLSAFAGIDSTIDTVICIENAGATGTCNNSNMSLTVDQTNAVQTLTLSVRSRINSTSWALWQTGNVDVCPFLARSGACRAEVTLLYSKDAFNEVGTCTPSTIGVATSCSGTKVLGFAACDPESSGLNWRVTAAQQNDVILKPAVPITIGTFPAVNTGLVTGGLNTLSTWHTLTLPIKAQAKIGTYVLSNLASVRMAGISGNSCSGYTWSESPDRTVTLIVQCAAGSGGDPDGDGLCNPFDTDDDGDLVADGSDSAPLNQFVCHDFDADGCDECVSGIVQPTSNDGADLDGDGECNVGDNCPQIANAAQTNMTVNPAIDGSNPKERGDACECGDASNDGDVTVVDIVAANLCIFGTCANRDLCDANGDGECDALDLIAINAEVFSAGETSICKKDDAVGPIQTCPEEQVTCP